MIDFQELRDNRGTCIIDDVRKCMKMSIEASKHFNEEKSKGIVIMYLFST